MTKYSLFLLAATIALAQNDSSGNLGPRRIIGGRGGLSSGISVEYACYAEPGGNWSTGFGAGGVIGSGGDAVHRVMTDPATGGQFGYDLSIVGDASAGYKAVFKPLSIDGGSSIAAPKFPPPQPIRDRDTIVLDMMSSPDGSLKIVDYLRVYLTPRVPAAPAAASDPRDFSVDDGTISFDTSATTFWEDGKQLLGGFTGKPGSTLWVAFPGQGRYILSLVPHQGLVKSGVVNSNVFAFQDSGHTFEVRFLNPVAGAGKAWNLYVFHDPSYQPATQRAGAMNAGVDRLENLLAGR